jgi:hypothetical protein
MSVDLCADPDDFFQSTINVFLPNLALWSKNKTCQTNSISVLVGTTQPLHCINCIKFFSIKTHCTENGFMTQNINLTCAYKHHFRNGYLKHVTEFQLLCMKTNIDTAMWKYKDVQQIHLISSLKDFYVVNTTTLGMQYKSFISSLYVFLLSLLIPWRQSILSIKFSLKKIFCVYSPVRARNKLSYPYELQFF